MKTNKKLLGLLLSMMLVVCALLGLIACDNTCEHNWQAATCTKKATCSLCGEESGELAAHKWVDASCTEPKHCSLCSATEGEAKGHTGGTATCTDKAVCTSCNQPYGSTTSHTYDKDAVKAEALKSEANCTSGAVYYKSCACGAISTNDAETFISGDPIAHSYTEEAVKAEALKSDANCTSGAVYYKSCKCGAISENDADTFVSGSSIGHSYTEEIVKTEALKDAAICTSGAVYYKSCKCGAISENDADTFVSGNPIAHSYTEEIVKAESLKDAATCTSGAVYYKSCKCGTISTNAADTFVSGDPAPHTYNKDIVKSEAFKSDATCQSPAVYYKSCECGAVSENADDTFTSGSALPHTYVEVDFKDATCTTPAKKTYRCSCNDEYIDDVDDALGHDISGVEPVEVPVEGTSCEFILVYTCQRGDCKETVNGKTVEHHNYIASISKPATCLENGEKTLTCACGNTKTEVIEKDATGHVWEKGELTEGATTRTDKCTICNTTKSVTVYTGNKTDEMNTSDLKDQEIELNDANISLGSDVIDSIDDEKITVSADKVEGDDRKGLGIDKDKLAQVGDNPIYNFTINDGAISEFGEDNYATITLPYDLAEGEDVDSIAVWFINNKGELESIKATYNNGFVTFKTNHFSYYTVTRLTPEERCALYGCSYVKHVEEGSCTEDAYTLYVCVRCHKSEKKDVVVADGHDYETETTDATCTENGYIKYSCKDCDYSYRTKIAATGHSFEATEAFDATCTANGYVKYECANCDSEYTVVGDKAEHVLKNTVNAPTCEDSGYTIHECENCDYSYTDTYVSAIGHDYELSLWGWATDYSSAQATFICKNDSAHNSSVYASISITTVYGTCSDFVKTIYKASVSFNGTVYTNEQSVETGTPDHSFSTELKHNETEHWFECVCGEKKDVTSHTFENDTVTKEATCAESGESVATCACGETKTTVIPKTSTHSYVNGTCTVCGKGETGFYINLINSYKNINGFAIKLENISYVMKRENDGAWKNIGDVKQLDLTELYLFFENGELQGAATGKVSIFNGPFSNADAIFDIKAIISDGNVYITLDYGKDGAALKPMKLKYSIDELLETMFDEMEVDDLPWLADVLSFLTDTIIPVADTLIETNAADVDKVLESLFSIIFTVTEQENGSYLVSLDYDKLLALNEHLATSTVAELIDIYFGQGTFDDLVEGVIDILDLTISEIPDLVKEQGVDFDQLIADINALCAALTNNSDIDVNEFFEDEELADVKIGEYLMDEDYKESVEETAKALRENSAYKLVFNDNKDRAYEVVKNVIDMIKDSISIGFTTDENGALTSVILSADAFTFEEDSNAMELSFDLTIKMNGTIEVTWNDIIGDIDDSIVEIDEDLMDTSIRTNVDNYSGSMTYKGEQYSYMGMQYAFYRNNYDKVMGFMVEDNCGDWDAFSTMYFRERYGFAIKYLYDPENPGAISCIIVENLSTKETAEMQETDSGFTVTFDDGTTVEIASDVEEPNELYTLIFGEPDWKMSSVRDIEYYYNTVTGEYATENQHDFEIVEEALGEWCEDDGRLIRKTCKLCNYVEENIRYYCEYEEAVIDLSEFTDCGGKLEVRQCKCCGNISSINDTDIKCDMEEVEEKELFDENGNSIGYEITYACADCGLTFVEKMWTEAISSCEYYECEGTYIYNGAECLVKYEYKSWEEDHEYEYEYEMNGPSCSDGYKIHYICTVCGMKETWHSSGHRTKEEVLDLSEYGACGGTIRINRCTICDTITGMYNYNVHCNGEESTTDIVDEISGEVIGTQTVFTCKDCGLVWTSKNLSERESSCSFKVTSSTTITVGEETAINFESYSYNTSHKYEYTYKMNGATCNDGYQVLGVCSACGETINYYSSGCRIERKEIALDELGLCGGTFREYVCSICGKLSDYNENSMCWWSYTGTTDEGYNTYSCRNCGATKVIGNIYGEKDEECNGEYTYFVSYLVGGNEVYKFENTSTYTQHNYEYEFLLDGTSCEDGYTVISTCKDCGASSEDTGSYHSKYTMFTLENGEYENCCDSHKIIVQACPCGYDVNVSLNDSYFANEDYSCDECGLSLSHSINTTDEGCAAVEAISVIIKLSDTELYSYEKEKFYANHIFENIKLSTVDGKSTMSITCKNCDAKIQSEILQAVLEQHGKEYYYDFTFTPSETGKYTILSFAEEDTYVTLYKTVGSQLVEIAYDDDNGYNNQFLLKETLTAGTTYVYRISNYVEGNSGDIGFMFSKDASFEGECNHDKYISFAELLDGSASCEDGAIYGRVYSKCGCIAGIYLSTEHETISKEYYNLEEFGACYGYVRFYSCACGDSTDLDFNCCYTNWTDNEYYDDNGNLVYVTVETCSNCGLRNTHSQYTVRDKKTCTEITYYTLAINIGENLVVQKEYINACESHDYTVTGSLDEGSTSCDDGVILTYTCKDCDYSYESHISWHKQYESERIDLAAYGSVCGGYAVVSKCACGQYSDLSIDHSLCDFGSYGCDIWIEDVITDSQYTTGGWNRFSYTSQIYKCAVTDPVEDTCTFKIRYASYWLKDDDSCYAQRYQTYQFGYNEEDGTYEYEVTINTGDFRPYHNYTVSTNDYGERYDCPDCGSYYYEYNYYNEEGYRTKHEKVVSNTLDNSSSKYYERVVEYEYDTYGNSYVSREFEKHIYADGEEYWYEELRDEKLYDGPFGENGREVISSSTNSYGDSSQNSYAYVYYKGYRFEIYRYTEKDGGWEKCEYSYSFDNGCIKTTVYTNDSGENYTETENICRMYNWITLENGTCTQDGLQCHECVVCETRSEPWATSPQDHDWVGFENGIYVCYRCGLENANGASGSVVMEDLSYTYGEGKYYVVGYWARNDVEFTYYVSLILADGTEIILDGIEFTSIDGVRSIAFSKSAVDTIAAEKGYAPQDYDVRFSFVPYGEDGSFDYGLTFTEVTGVDVIKDSVTFSDYISEYEINEYTITPEKDGIWHIVCETPVWCYAFICDADGNEIFWDGLYYGFDFTCELKAGETYTLNVANDCYYTGPITLSFTCEAMAE